MLRDFRRVYDDIFVTSCDDEAMHPNINTEKGLAFTMAVLDSFTFKVKSSW